jgi:hypothetical protein
MDTSMLSLDDSMADFDSEIEAWSDEFADGEMIHSLQKTLPKVEWFKGDRHNWLKHSDSMI